MDERQWCFYQMAMDQLDPIICHDLIKWPDQLNSIICHDP
jgi:hypothetical protein